MYGSIWKHHHHHHLPAQMHIIIIINMVQSTAGLRSLPWLPFPIQLLPAKVVAPTSMQLLHNPFASILSSLRNSWFHIVINNTRFLYLGCTTSAGRSPSLLDLHTERWGSFSGRMQARGCPTLCDWILAQSCWYIPGKYTYIPLISWRGLPKYSYWIISCCLYNTPFGHYVSHHN